MVIDLTAYLIWFCSAIIDIKQACLMYMECYQYLPNSVEREINTCSAK